MRIASIEVDTLDLVPRTALTVAYGSYPLLEYALIKVHTDDGHVGLGEASPDPVVTGETRGAVVDALMRASEFLVGKDPFDLDAIIRLCIERIGGFPAAMAAIDMAMYDLMGKSLGVPAYRLLGGKSRPGMALYPVVPLDEPAVMAEMARSFSGMGATTIKVKLGTDPAADLERMRAIRDAVGGSIRFRVDVNQGWHDAETAVAAIRSMAGFKLEYVEQPVAALDLEGMARVCAEVDVPIMADESCHGPEDLMAIATRHAADMVNIKLMKCGGIYRATAMLAVAAAAGLPCILGSMGESSVGSAAGLHLAVARQEIAACELIGPMFVENDPAVGFDVDMATFTATPSGDPGLGVRLK